MIGSAEMEMFHLSAHLRLLATEEGGRHGPVLPGYRPTFYFGQSSTDGMIQIVGRDRALPGEEFDVQVTLLHPEHVEHVLKPGTRFEVKEGLRKVAEGQVLSVFGSGA